MVKRFFSVRIPFFGTVAMLVLCMVFFLLPFALRGARMAITDMQNNVADWLPSHFPETVDLKEFRKYFVGDQFVVVSGTWCKEGDGAFTNLVRKIREESLEYEKVLKETKQDERLRACRKGDELGLLYAGNYHEDWGQEREKWLLGKKGQWYFINRRGQLYRWEGQNNVIEGIKRSFERTLNGKNKANGTYVDTFGPPPNDAEGTQNPFYADPQKLCARPFKSVTTGPEVFEKMAGPNGTIILGNFNEDDLSTFQAKIEAHKRLTGAPSAPRPATNSAGRSNHCCTRSTTRIDLPSSNPNRSTANVLTILSDRNWIPNTTAISISFWRPASMTSSTRGIACGTSCKWSRHRDKPV